MVLCEHKIKTVFFNVIQRVNAFANTRNLTAVMAVHAGYSAVTQIALSLVVMS